MPRTPRGSRLPALAAALLAGASLAAPAARAADPIKLGVLEDQSGDFAVATIGKVHGIQLAADEINAAGGIAGRKLELVIYDTQSDNTRYQEFMRRVLQRDKVNAVFAGFSSASREAYRPIVDQLDGFAFYNNQYEGGVCDGHMVVTGAVPEQQFSTLIPWMMEKFGKRVYTIAADYNFGQISAEWVRNIVKENGGEMVGEEFIPLGVSQFSQTIQNIQKAKPDILMTLLVGTAQASYYEQAAAANLKVPMGSSVNIGQGYEHKRFQPPSLANMYVTTNYIEEVDSPSSKAFLAKWKAKFPNEPYVNQEAENSYLAVYLYKQMVERANGSTKRADLRKVIAAGDVCVDAPEGKVCIDPKSQHASHTIYLAKVDEKHAISFPKTWDNIQPYWLGKAGCDLTQKDPMAQYTPSNPPKP
ncbi:urea ABC transporter substrate-binding protein [Methylobacterium sp. PvP062]|jgi:urea ABC transporter substrate-binding protein|uniref:Branched-chain amino acid transport system substrate-binding protein n=3 Tax=Methylobacterium TaxID=407 RepID=A0ABV2NKE3_9HYPH|nr:MULTISPECIES: urea ABC transporter substrate-binding protein [Methylobacterium]MCX7334257.1 urea ABC transporter substrate-binding protein [Hyphomicrobiales bacterium]GAN46644.1 urea/short-chain amide transporter substrate-binding protein [Methylobacterium sp. ME121]ACB25300.1 putative UreA/short-chain amide transport system substrate-binding protein precursor [Methylobacterium radiotolerans JCM 2831]KTS09646.1 urea ABC transporter substrate-binding protein [Methylobacterium radiotolerans]K